MLIAAALLIALSGIDSGVEPEKTHGAVIRKVEAVGGQIMINPRPGDFTLTYSHRDLGRDTDCRGVLTAEIIIGRKSRVLKDIAFAFSDIAPTETYTMRFGSELLDSLRAAHPDVDPTFIKFDKNSDYLDIKTAHCFFGPPIDSKIILDKPHHVLRVYVHPSSVHLLFTNEDSPPFYHYRCTVGIKARVLKSKQPDTPLVFSISTGQVAAQGVSHAFGGIREIQERRRAEGRGDLEFDFTPGKTRIANRYCWQGGETQFPATYQSGFAILPGGKDALRYSSAKSNGVISSITSEKDGPSLDSSLRGPWQAMAIAKDGGQFMVSAKNQLALFDLATFKELGQFPRAVVTGDVRLHRGSKRLVTTKEIIATDSGKVLRRFPEPLSHHDLSADGRTIVGSLVTKNKGLIRIMELASGRVVKEFSSGTTAAAIAVAGDAFYGAAGRTVQRYALANGAPQQSFSLPSEALAITAAGDAFAVLSRQHITVWHNHTGEQLATISYKGTARAIRLRPRAGGYVVGIKRRLVRKNIIDFWLITRP